MDDLLYARLQMALSLGFHIVFAAIGIAMPALMAIAERRWIRTGSEAARQLTKRWAKGTAILFAVGAVSGTVLSFELGLLWPRFMDHAGGIIGVPFGLEGFAFFTEAIFLGIYLYGWNRVGRWVHWCAGVVIAISGATSALFIIMVNGWMNSPAGFDFDPATGVFSNIDPVAAMFNRAWAPQALHMLAAAYLSTAAAVAGVHAVGLLRGRDTPFNREGLKIALLVAAPMAVIQPFTGDWAARVVARDQPVKLAAMEGQWDTERGAPLRIGGLPDATTETTPFAIDVPKMLSFLAYGDFNAEVKGLKSVPERDRPPVAITHVSFQIMVACGMALLATSVWGAWALVRRRTPSRTALRAIALASPLGFVAIEAGWTVTEVGRQPWIIHGVMRTSDAVTPMPGLIGPFLTFTIVYALLGVAVVLLMREQFRASPDADAGGAPDAH